MARSQKLPGLEDTEIKDLQDAAIEYAELRDERMDLSRKEGELKSTLLGLMKKHKRSS